MGYGFTVRETIITPEIINSIVKGHQGERNLESKVFDEDASFSSKEASLPGDASLSILPCTYAYLCYHSTLAFT